MENVWMVRAGEGGYLINDFAKGFVAVGYQGLGDMSSIKDLKTIRKKYLAAYRFRDHLGYRVPIFNLGL